jgi:hypothetical protein
MEKRKKGGDIDEQLPHIVTIDFGRLNLAS